HGSGLVFRVHVDAVPGVGGDGRVVGGADAAADVDAGVAAHRRPAPGLGLGVAGEDRLVLRLADAARVPRADVDGFAAGAIAELGPVGLAAGAGQRFVAQDQLVVHGEVRDRQKEPLALTHVHGVLAASAGLAPESLASLGEADLGRLEGFL